MKKEKGPHPVYREVQRFRQPWIWVIVLGLAGLVWCAAVSRLVLHRPFGTRPMPDIVLAAFWVAFGIGLPALFFFGRLVTEVHDDGICIRFSPFHRRPRRIALFDVRRCGVRTYRPVRDYGGWGIRRGSGGTAYTVSGSRGVEIELSNGERILIGSRRADELCEAIEQARGRTIATS